jgi:radical SAM superfamily enzyme YgiQ (UPF0313 family)
LALALLGAVCRERGHEVTLIDSTGEKYEQFMPLEGTGYFIHGLSTEEVVSRIPKDTDFIGITCMFSNEWLYHRHFINRIADEFPGIPLVVGGEHATAAGAYVLRCCPGVIACVMGEGEDTLLDMLDALKHGRPLEEVPGLLLRDGTEKAKRTAPRSRMRHLDELPWPAWDLLPIRNYLDAGAAHGTVGRRTMPMLASRGCPYRCTFCSNPQMWGKLWSIRSPEDVVKEMTYYKNEYDVDSFAFYDLTAVIKRDWILEFTRLILEAELNVNWLLPSGTRSEALDRTVVAAMRKSGCLTLNLAPESGSPHTLERIKKQVKLDKMLTTVRSCAREGIFARANIIFGFPGERPRHMAETLVFIVQLAWAGLHDIAIFPFAPYPGSELQRELSEKGMFPPEGDEYDRMLASNLNNNYSRPKSWNEYVSDSQLRMLLVGGSLMFYVLQYAFRPWRLIATATRLLTDSPSTLIERVMSNALHRLLLMKPNSAPDTAAHAIKSDHATS